MARNITSGTRVAILEPSSTNVLVLLVDHMFDIRTVLLDAICHEDASNTSADGQNPEFAVAGIIEGGVRIDVVARGARL